MLQELRERVARIRRLAGVAADKVVGYVLDYGLPTLILTCLAAGLILLVWAHWAVD